MTVILDNGQMFRITKIMGLVDGRPTVDTPSAGPLAVFFEPSDKSTVSHRGWWYVNNNSNIWDYFLNDKASMVQKEKKLLELMVGTTNNCWYRYTGKNDRHNADLIPQEKRRIGNG